MNSYEKFIKLLKENIEEAESNQSTENREYDPDIIFDDLIKDSQLRLDWIDDFHADFKHDIEEWHVIRLAENLVKILELIDYRRQFTIKK